MSRPILAAALALAVFPALACPAERMFVFNGAIVCAASPGAADELAAIIAVRAAALCGGGCPQIP